MESLDVVLMTGNSNKGNIHGIPKCYLELPDKTNPAYNVFRAAQNSDLVRYITVIGPKEHFDKIKLDCLKKPTLWIPQRKNATFSDNLFDAFENSSYRLKNNDIKGALYLSGDTPFRTTESINFAIKNTNESDEVTIFMTPESQINYLSRFQKKPLTPIIIDNEFVWTKADDMVFIRPDKLPREKIDLLYQHRYTNKLTWALGITSFMQEYSALRNLLIKGWVLRKIRTLRNGSHESNDIPSFLLKGLGKGNIENLVRENPPHINGHIVSMDYSDGYLDIDTEKDYKNIKEFYFSLKQLIEEKNKDLVIL